MSYAAQKNRRGLPEKQRGFTLIEVVIALGLMAVIVTITYSTLNGILEMKRFVDDGQQSQSIANALITRITRELQLADSNIALLPTKSNPDKRYGRNTNLIGTAQQLSGGAEGDTISFMARGASQYVMEGPGWADVAMITYRVAPDPEQRNDREATYLLIREETPDIRPIDKAFERTMVFPVTNRLVSLSFKYWNTESDEWINEWAEEKQVGLPRLVQFTLKIKSPAGKIETYVTAVPLRSSQAP